MTRAEVELMLSEEKEEAGQSSGSIGWLSEGIVIQDLQ